MSDNRLVFVSKTDKRTNAGSVISIFRCSCGHVGEHVEYRVFNNVIKSCGCLRKTKDTTKSGFKALFTSYRYNAKKRGLEFPLTFQEFIDITSQPCHYCGLEPQKTRRRMFEIFASGIDRKSSKIGYELKNCLPCCSTCNFCKNDLSYEEFVSWAKRVANFLEAK